MSYSYQYSSSSYGTSGDAGAAGAAGEYSASFGGDASFGSASYGAGSYGATEYSSSSATYSAGGASGASFSASAGGASGALVSAGAGGASDAASTNRIANDLLAMARGGAGGAGGSVSGGNASTYLSEVEQAILRSQVPIDINETEEITVNGQRGIWANRQEVVNWRGVIPINQYLINEDANPEIVTKRTQQRLEYIQELAIRYLRPPTPPAPGEIVITQETNTLTPPAPPLVLRQQPPRPDTPAPLVVREAPPNPPDQVGRKVITISGKRLPPPPRKVVIERLAPLPSKPQSVIVERWLPYSQVKRRVIFQKSNERDPVIVKPRNVIVQWEAPQVSIRKDIKYLGVIRANPVEYVQKYGATLKQSRELPEFVLDIKTPDGLVLAADYTYNSIHELEGEVQALRLIDLDREGLSQYRAQLQRLGITSGGGSFSASSFSASGGASFSASGASAGGAAGNLIAEVFAQIDGDSSGSVSVEEAEKVLLRLNSRLGRSYGENEVKAFFRTLDVNGDGQINLQEFRAAFERLL